MKQINEIYRPIERPIRIAQFGEGNFLRAFADWMIDIANESGDFAGNIAVIKPRAHGDLDAFRAQDYMYTVQLRGAGADGQPLVASRVVRSIGAALNPYRDAQALWALARSEELRFVLSNTTESGIEFRADDPFPGDGLSLTFPGKLTQLLMRRFEHFGGGHGLIMLPTELNDRNGDLLRDCVMRYSRAWGLGAEFERWVEEECVFACTLVDRIVTGYPRDEADAIERELGYHDALLTTGEPFALWVIETPRDISAELPLDRAGLPVVFTRDIRPYKERKVRLLNGAHTSSVHAAYLAGCRTVLDMMRDETMRRFIEGFMFDEAAGCVPLPADEARAFAGSVLERFANPYVRHQLLSISLNSFAKWRARLLPTLKDNVSRGALPRRTAFSLAAMLSFYTGERTGEGYFGQSADGPYPIADDERVIDAVSAACRLDARGYAHAILAREDFWGEDLTRIAGLEDAVAGALERIRSVGMRRAVEELG